MLSRKDKKTYVAKDLLRRELFWFDSNAVLIDDEIPSKVKHREDRKSIIRSSLPASDSEVIHDSVIVISSDIVSRRNSKVNSVSSYKSMGKGALLDVSGAEDSNILAKETTGRRFSQGSVNTRRDGLGSPSEMSGDDADEMMHKKYRRKSISNTSYAPVTADERPSGIYDGRILGTSTELKTPNFHIFGFTSMESQDIRPVSNLPALRSPTGNNCVVVKRNSIINNTTAADAPDSSPIQTKRRSITRGHVSVECTESKEGSFIDPFATSKRKGSVISYERLPSL